ncbi:unnamed protein product [Rotaria sp. Silwood1]|nr:unnamed protein product [Rotaria sp. Silwood1]
MHSAICTSMRAEKAIFFRARLIETILNNVTAHGANFSRSSVYRAELLGATLTMASFVQADLTNAKLSDANFFGANFSLADLRNTQISPILIGPMAFIRGARLSMTSYLENLNIISNGYVDGQTSLERHWIVENGSVFVFNNGTNCIFATNSTFGAYLVQRFNFASSKGSKFSHLFSERRAALMLTARYGNTTSIGLQWGNQINAAKRILNSSIGSLRWQDASLSSYLVTVWVQFAPTSTIESNWCDDIYFDIDDAYAS